MIIGIIFRNIQKIPKENNRKLKSRLRLFFGEGGISLVLCTRFLLVDRSACFAMLAVPNWHCSAKNSSPNCFFTLSHPPCGSNPPYFTLKEKRHHVVMIKGSQKASAFWEKGNTAKPNSFLYTYKKRKAKLVLTRRRRGDFARALHALPARMTVATQQYPPRSAWLKTVH